MIKGTIKFFNKAKGFGFITPDDGSRDVFLPPTTVTVTGAARLKTGQRVTFEAEPDVKGPKAVKLQLLDEPVKEIAAPAAPAVPAPAKAGVTLYYDSTDEEADEVLEALKASGPNARLIDYSATPLTQDQLRRLALMLREVDQSLVRRYDHLFLELQLDDRFISESDFWTAIFEHPVLVNGPVVVAGNRASICKSAGELRAFLGMDGEEAELKTKKLSPRMMAMITGQPVPDHPPKEAPRKIEPAPKPAAKAEPEPPADAPKAKKPAAKKAEAAAEKPAKAKKAVAKEPAKAKPAKKAKK